MTTPHVCGIIIMLFLRQQALESSVKFDRLPRNVRKVALCLSLGAVRGRRLFSLLRFRYKILKRGKTEMPSAKILSEKQAYVADLKAKVESAVSAASSLTAALTS